MTTILWVIGFVVVYFLVTGYWERLREAIWPFEHREVALHELKGHFNELYKRGYNGSQMIITAEGTDKSIRLKKVIEGFDNKIRLHLITEDGKKGHNHEEQGRLKSLLEDNDIPCDFGPGYFASSSYGINVKCGDSVDMAALAAEQIFLKFYGLSEDATYRLSVKGMIGWQDRLIDSENPNTLAVWYMTLDGMFPAGRPYKRYHIPNKFSPFYLLGTITAKVIRIMHRLFGG